MTTISIMQCNSVHNSPCWGWKDCWRVMAMAGLSLSFMAPGIVMGVIMIAAPEGDFFTTAAF